MLMKIMCKIKIIIIIKTLLKKQQQQKKKTNTITTNKTLIYNRENTYRGREREKKNYYIQTIKRLPCLKCSVNITFIKTKRTKT